MLNNIPAILPPDLVKYMMEMGHGDTLVIADAHFPAHAYGKRVIRCDGIGGVDMLEAILKLLPLDSYVDFSVKLMDIVPGDCITEVPIWGKYEAVISRYDNKAIIQYLDRFDFYKESEKSYVIIQTGERAQYANLILTKGIVGV